MSRLVRRNDGYTLVELLVVMTVALVMLTATLTTFEDMQRETRDQDRRTQSAEVARRALDTTARQLRNLAKRITAAPVIRTVDPYDFMFQTSDPARTWVRYCLDTGSSPNRGRLWGAALKVDDPSAPPPDDSGMTSSCPGNGWTTKKVVADFVVNRINGQTRPVFSYTCIDGGTNCLSGTSKNLDQVINVNARLFVDTTPTKHPPELTVATGIHLRNQNQVPTAAFQVTTVPNPPRTVMFNASGSNDYEGRTLAYFWFSKTMPGTIRCDQPTPTATTTSSGTTKQLWGGNLIGEGVVLQHTFPASDASPVQIGLVVCDPGDRYHYTTQAVAIP